jgi:hypothetical protein
MASFPFIFKSPDIEIQKKKHILVSSSEPNLNIDNVFLSTTELKKYTELQQLKLGLLNTFTDYTNLLDIEERMYDILYKAYINGYETFLEENPIIYERTD